MERQERFPLTHFLRVQQKRILLQHCEIDLCESGARVTLGQGNHHRLFRHLAELQLSAAGLWDRFRLGALSAKDWCRRGR